MGPDERSRKGIMTSLACPQSQRPAAELLRKEEGPVVTPLASSEPAAQTVTDEPAPVVGASADALGDAATGETLEAELAAQPPTSRQPKGAPSSGPEGATQSARAAPGRPARPDRLDLLRADRELFVRYSPLVRRIALRSVRTLPRSLTVDDIVSAGWVGMAEAIGRRPGDMPEEQFEAYASYRIRGAILDYLRALDPLSRKLRNAVRRIAAATRALTHELGRAPRDEEIAERLGIDIEEYHRTLCDIHDAGFDRVEGVGPLEPQATTPSPEALASKSELVGNVAGAVEELPERLQVVLGLHYQQECSLREIGEILGVTESRVCQLHAEALQRLRARLEGKTVPSGRRRRAASM